MILAALLSLSMKPLFASESPIIKVALSDVEAISYSEGGKLKGINYEILRKIEISSGLKFDYSLYPHARISKDLFLAAPDLTILLTGTCDKFSDYEHSGSLYQAVPAIYVNKSYKPPFKNMRIGRIRGTCSDLTTEYVKSENVVDLPNLKPAFEMLEMGRLDGICGIDFIVEDILKNEPKLKEQIVIYKTQNHDLEKYQSVVCRKKGLSADVKAKLDKAIKNLKIHI